ncbi:MAG: hypothetical protein GY754_21760 [bacterium]|nr:hypothetical protein [bacterium]
MERDFHHAVTYVLARSAGFDKEESDIIAYSNQYVDDATNSGFITFENDIMYYRTTSAYKTTSLNNLSNELNRSVWLPFHFLPGNEGKKAPKKLEGVTISKLICTPDSYIARDMVSMCMKDLDEPYALHRLGVGLHVFSDTWSHQGFAGITHSINTASDYKRHNTQMHMNILFFIRRLVKIIKHIVTNELVPLGHGPVLTNPDLPFLDWEYTNGAGETVRRDNHEIFMNAVDRVFEVMAEFNKKYSKKKKIKRAIPKAIDENDRKKISNFMKTFTNENEFTRHDKWLKAITAGEFSFGPEEVSYQAKGAGSWKHEALGTEKEVDDDHEVFTLKPGFLTSNWKYFHDAVRIHRHQVLYDILPGYSIYLI